MQGTKDARPGRRWWWISGLVALALAGVVAFTTTYVWRTIRVPGSYATTSGVIVDTFRECGDCATVSVIQFEAGGLFHSFRQTGSNPGVGARVTVEYVPEDPATTATTGYGRADSAGTAAIVGLIATGILAYWLVISVRYAKAGGPPKMTFDLPPRIDE